MHPSSRTLLRVAFDASGEALTLEPAAAPAAGRGEAKDLVDRLMGRKPEHRLAFIQENAKFADALDVWYQVLWLALFFMGAAQVSYLISANDRKDEGRVGKWGGQT